MLTPVQGRPGVFFDDQTRTYKRMAFESVQSRYDTVEQAAGAISAGAILTLFRDLTNKNKIDANFPAAGKLVTGSEHLDVNHIGIELPQIHDTAMLTARDAMRITSHGYLDFKLNGQTVCEGVLAAFPGGYGVVGNTTESNTTIVSNGVAAMTAVKKWQETQLISEQHQVEATITFQNRTWISNFTMPTLDNAVGIRCHVHGRLSKAATLN
jgi:hypothetical protein